MIEIWNSWELYTFKYSIGALQAISAVFMLWAFIKLYLAIRRSEALSNLMDQRMIMIHLATFLIYLASLAIFYTLYWFWGFQNEQAENKVYVSWTVSNICITVVQLVLIYLFWKLSNVSS